MVFLPGVEQPVSPSGGGGGIRELGAVTFLPALGLRAAAGVWARAHTPQGMHRQVQSLSDTFVVFVSQALLPHKALEGKNPRGTFEIF